MSFRKVGLEGEISDSHGGEDEDSFLCCTRRYIPASCHLQDATGSEPRVLVNPSDSRK
jgi:hypothetical protein